MILDVKFEEQITELSSGDSVIAQAYKGKDGYTPVKNVDYFDGKEGMSAYEVARKNGFEGTETEWLESLKGEDDQTCQTASGEFLTVQTERESSGALTIHGKTLQKTYTGKNLLDLSKCEFISCKYVDGKVVSNTKNEYYATIRTLELNDLMMANLGKTFTFSADKGFSGKMMSIIVAGTKSDGTSYQEVSCALGSNFITMTLSNLFTSISRVDLRWNRAYETFEDTTSVITDIQFELGEKSSYEPFVGKKASPNPEFPQSVNGVVASAKRTGKNLLKNNLMAGTTKNGITITLNADGTVTANGTATDNAVFYYAFGVSATKNLTLGTEYILTGAPKGSGNSCYLSTWRIDSDLTTKNEFGNGLKFLCTNKSNPDFSIMIVFIKGATVNNVVFKPMIRLASITDDTFEPYSGSELSYNTSELFEGDSINAVGKLTRRFKKIVFDGVTSGLKMTNTGSNVRGFFAKFEDMKKGADNVVASLLCSHFPTRSIQQIILNANYFGIANNSNCNLYICFDSANPLANGTLEQCNAWLKAQYDAGTPVTVVYELASVVEEEPTRNGDLTLTKGINHIFSTEAIAPEYMLEYSPKGYPLFDWLYPTEKLYLKSASGKTYAITVNDSGAITATEV